MKSWRAASLRSRLLLTAALVLVLFLSGTGVALDRAFQNSIRSGAEEQLRIRVLGLLGSTDVGPMGLRLPIALPEPRFNQPGSGLYAWVLDGRGRELWASQSLVGRDTGRPIPMLEPGEASFQEVADGEGDRLYRYAMGVVWEGPMGDTRYVFAVATAQAPFLAEAQGFRRALFAGLGGAGLALLAVLVSVLAISLRPLRRLSREVERVERGSQERLTGTWPQELSGLARNLNLLVDHERSRQQRYRNTLDDLTHSLKTPLAILRNALADIPEGAPLAQEQIERMQSIINHHLQRASVARNPLRSQRTNLAEPVRRIVAGLSRLHVGSGLVVTADIPADLTVAVDERDLYDIVGNLVENACKFGRHQVRVKAWSEQERVVLEIADDGPGIPASLRASVLDRGTRVDTQTPGQGLGLGLASELVASWGGRLQVAQSEDLGGAAMRVELMAGAR